MGTSGAYGGSGSQSWDAVHDSYADAATAGGGGPSQAQIENFVNTFMTALAKTPGQAGGPTSFSLASLRLTRSAGTGGGSSSSATSGGGGRNVARQAARGAAAVAEGVAARAGAVHLHRQHAAGRAKPSRRGGARRGDAAHHGRGPENQPGDDRRTDDGAVPAEPGLRTGPRRTDLAAAHRQRHATARQTDRREGQEVPTRQRCRAPTDKAKITAQGFVDYAATLAGKVFTVFRMRGRQ